MTSRVLACIRHNNGQLEETAGQLASAAKKIDPSSTLTAVIAGFGGEFEKACESLRAIYQEVWKITEASLTHPTPELLAKVLVRVLPEESVVLFAHDQFGMDVGPGLSIGLNSAYVADVIGVDHLERTNLRVVCQEFGGQLNTHVMCDISAGAVITVRPGAFKATETVPLSGVIVDKPVDLPPYQPRRRYLSTVAAAVGDVDITRYDVLVSVGRGIQKPENIPLAQELADVLGAAVSCSRPVVDANWLDKSRQVGTSGKTVKPKVYLACGISGQFQHLAGLKGSPFIIAVNKNPKAPIFQVADVGVVADILEFLPELTNKVREAHSAKLVIGATR